MSPTPRTLRDSPPARGDVARAHRLVSSLCAALAPIHAAGRAHGTLHPDGIGVNADGLVIEIAPSEATAKFGPSILPYLAPEQTGRMNRGGDTRSDFYSIGVILYELLAGHPPFRSADPLEIIHWHLARAPTPLAELDPRLPAIMGGLTEKLLAKSPDGRYQTLAGLRADLERCRPLLGDGSAPAFVLGDRDVPERIRLPFAFYGRAEEEHELTRALDAACEGNAELVLVTGPPGIGKTALIQRLEPAVGRRRGYFGVGKFDQVAHSKPYGALLHALSGVLDQIVAEGPERQRAWRETFTTALEGGLSVIAELLPILETIVGPQPPAVPLGPADSQTRFERNMQALLSAIARAEHPLVLFLDDLQWADPATIRLLSPLCDSAAHLLVILAVRDGELTPEHPVQIWLDGRRAAGPLAVLHLSPLSEADMTALLADALLRSHADVEPLAKLLRDKTEGNPFFLLQYVKKLHDEGLVTFERDARHWTFDLAGIERQPVADNVVTLLAETIERLPLDVQNVLRVAGCVGSRFDAEVVAAATGASEAKTLELLAGPAARGLVEWDGERFMFAHDRVQQAACEGLPRAELPTVHLGIGRYLQRHPRDDTRPERALAWVHHLNAAGVERLDGSERIILAEANFEAGRAAASSVAWQAALEHFERSERLFGDDSWDERHAVRFELGLRKVECLFASRVFDAVAEQADALRRRARTPTELAAAVYWRKSCFEVEGELGGAIEICLEVLAELGLVVPADPEVAGQSLAAELERITELRAGRTVEELAGLPEISDERARAIIKTLSTVWVPIAASGNVARMQLVGALIVRHSLEFGACAEAAFGMTQFGVVVAVRSGELRAGADFGRLGLMLADRFGQPRHIAEARAAFFCTLEVYVEPFPRVVERVAELVRFSRENLGDTLWAGYLALFAPWYRLNAALPLATALEQLVRNSTWLHEVGMTVFESTLRVQANLIRALQGELQSPGSISGPGVNVGSYAAALESSHPTAIVGGDPPIHLAHFVLGEALLAYLWGRYEDALNVLERGASVLRPYVLGIVHLMEDLLSALALAALERGDALVMLREKRARLERAARACPANFRAWSELVAGEVLRLEGDPDAAARSFANAADAAREQENPLNEGLAFELLSRLWRSRSNRTLATVFLLEARHRFERWGAHGKVRELEARHPELGRQRAPSVSGELALDAATVIKAARAISSRMLVADLLAELLRISIESAGARRGFVVSERNGGLHVDAEADIEGARVIERPLEDLADPLVAAVVHYVSKLPEPLVLADARSDTRFSRHGGAGSAGPSSVLCVPIRHRGTIHGFLYLENDLTSDAFGPDRVQVIEVLTAQAGVSLENAKLFDERVRAAERLQAALLEVESLKNRLHAENLYLQEEIRREHDFEDVIGNSPALLSVLDEVASVAGTDSTVLIHGESGTGKELIARAIHERGNRRGRPLVKVNCGAISAGLVESELFGHVRGAFTGAIDKRVGRFELANGGTIFLDEVGELPLDTQVRLLRVLQEHEFEPVGSSRALQVDVRVIAATNRNLKEEVAAGRFRADLYYRLNVFPITLPPLRKRASDVPALTTYFLERFSRKTGREIRFVAQATMDRLMAYSWPGNIRELQNVIERAVVLSRGDTLVIGDDVLLERVHAEAPPPSATVAPPISARSLRDAERAQVLDALDRAGWIIEGPQGAATRLGLHPNTLRSRLKKMGIQRPGPKAPGS